MITRRASDERGRFDHGWLDTRHTFSFGRYHDPRHMGFRALRVINEDVVAPGAGFPEHGHEDMEIISYVLSGALAHRDSTGGQETLRPGEVQRMTAGGGIEHSEFNPSASEPAHFLQIWIRPERRGLTPSYEQRAFGDLDGRLRLIASPDAQDGSLRVHQDVRVLAGRLTPGQSARVTLGPGRHAWVQVARGRVEVNGVVLSAGDGAALSDEPEVRVSVLEPAELLVFDLA